MQQKTQQNKTNKRVQPCYNCGSIDIGVKDTIVYTPWRTELRKVWAYCRICNAKGGISLCNLDTSESDEIELAFNAWNAKPRIQKKQYPKKHRG